MVMPQELRDWQSAAWERIISSGTADYLQVACPGAGKTALALHVARYYLDRHDIARVVIVTPTEHLKEQWAEAATRHNIHLDPHWQGERPEGPNFDGLVVTYAHMGHGNNPIWHRRFCQRPTLAIFDEIHHSANERTWGEGIQKGFENAWRRLSLSGTPFRSDNIAISFVKYDENQRSVPDGDSYGYADAIREGVCRPVIFPGYEGTLTYQYRGEVVTRTFDTEVSEQEHRTRLRTALDPRGQWLPTILKEANQTLTELRNGPDPDAGGLILAMNQRHAHAISGLVEKSTGIIPAVVVSDDPKASQIIDQFKASSRPWIIAVKMVSEGVDIPRLRVEVYATNTMTEMFFRQAMGRIVRMRPEPEEQDAYMFFPDDPILRGFAEQIREERDHILWDIEPDEGPAPGGEHTPEDDSFIGAEAQMGHIVYENDSLTPAEMENATNALVAIGVQSNLRDKAIAAKLLRKWNPSENEPIIHTGPPRWQIKRTLKQNLWNKVNVLHYATGKTKSHKSIYSDLKVQCGEWASNTDNLDILKNMITTVQGWINDCRGITTTG